MPEPLQKRDDDELYEALLAALSASAKGRAFLAEHARRARGADTTGALDMLARIEARLTAGPAGEPPPAAVLPAEPSETAPPAGSEDVIAQVMALTPEERIALFS